MSTDFMQVEQQMRYEIRQPERCECHDCTHVRWKMSLQHQFEITAQAQQAEMERQREATPDQ